ncbi:LysR family transcriptional regulator [Acinetobacter bohemicus]|uniref:LysR family transcriptional regulator n=1 Tax=Acinetobacter bohemicus TaxID=1435036 RepID=UPI00192A8A64|nr:LysR family transcriptional regulator [Acinetobacter bohemicus]CAD9194199.1 putative HTH-type transcriptional regulator LtrA [Acinetobacter bohemicus]CAD9194869.1 putative HTH-type transcriptional regulator LtrA [Acinetobacter bohemicus]
MSTNQIISLLQEMAIFVKVVETGSFSETARQLGNTPSAISRAISRLERALGTRLLQRTTRKLRLSESGTQVYAYCLEMVNAAQAVIDNSGKFNSEPHGTVRISVPKAVGHYLLHPHIPEFLERYPKVDVQMLLEDKLIDFIDDEIDLAIRITNQPSLGLKGRKLIEIDHVIVATAEYLEKHGIPQQPQDLKEHQCIYLGEQASDSKWKFQKENKITSVSVKGRYSANHTGIRLDAALKHMGIASLPYFVARHALETQALIQVLPDWYFKTYYSGDAWLLYPPTRYLAPKIEVFIHFLAEKLKLEPTLKNE